MGDEVRRCENYLVAYDVLVFHIVQCSFFLDGEDVAVAIKEVVIVRVDYAVLFYEFDEFVFSEDAHV